MITIRRSISSRMRRSAPARPQRFIRRSSCCNPIRHTSSDLTALNGSGGWDDYYPEINFFKNAPVCTRTTATFYTTIKLLQPNKTYKLRSDRVERLRRLG